MLTAARAVVAPIEDRLGTPLAARPGAPGEVAFWRCANERAQAQSVAADIERLMAREDVAPEDVCVLVRSVKGEGQAVAVALEERAVPHRLAGAAAFFQRAEVRDLLAWLRLVVDPGTPAPSSARWRARRWSCARSTSRAAPRSPAAASSTWSPRSARRSSRRRSRPRRATASWRFLRMYRAAAAALDSTRPDLYVHRLIERLGLRRQLLFAASTEAVERLVNLAKFGELAASYVRRSPQATAREFARSIAAVAEAGLREEEAVPGERPRAVQVMTMHAAKGREFDHVYVLGLMSARMPGPRQRALEPIPDALLRRRSRPTRRPCTSRRCGGASTSP